jgi:hypothetical protein
MRSKHNEVGLGEEQKPDGEADAIDRIIKAERQLFQYRIDHEHLPAPKKPVPRVQHPKHHGCVAAEFVIADDRDLPSELRVGVFREPGR